MRFACAVSGKVKCFLHSLSLRDFYEHKFVERDIMDSAACYGVDFSMTCRKWAELQNTQEGS